MIKPKRLKRGDKIAIVSLSWGGLGDEAFIHKYHIAKERLEKDFGLEVICMPHALRGSDFVAKHPELRAKDLMNAFKDDTIAAIFSAIGGDDTIRTLPYIDLQVIQDHPKIFMGYSDTTVNHLMMYQVGLTSFYGPSIMCEFGEYGKIFDYTKRAVEDFLFGQWQEYDLAPSSEWTADYILWDEKNIDRTHNMIQDQRGYEIINGAGIVEGHLLGGCLDVFMMIVGTKLWPTLEQWKDAILFIETSEDQPSPDFVKWTLRNLAAQGVLRVIKGIIVAKPQGEKYYEEYKEALVQVVRDEEKLSSLPIVYNLNFGHAKPIGIIPYGTKARLDCKQKTITLLESVTS